MSSIFKRSERLSLVVFILASVLTAIAGLYSLYSGCANGGKWLSSSGLLATLAGVIQLEVSGLFDRIINQYSNTKHHPYGPPSYITREIIDNPDKPILTWLRNMLFFETKTGFWLIVLGTLIQMPPIWF